MTNNDAYTLEDYNQAQSDVKKQEKIFSDATANGGTSHPDRYKTAINIARGKLKTIRDAMVAAGTLPADTPEVIMEIHSSQFNDVWSQHRGD